MKQLHAQKATIPFAGPTSLILPAGGPGASLPAQREGKLKKPFLIHRPDKRPFALAGIWDRSTSADGEIIDGCAVITRRSKLR